MTTVTTQSFPEGWFNISFSLIVVPYISFLYLLEISDYNGWLPSSLDSMRLLR